MKLAQIPHMQMGLFKISPCQRRAGCRVVPLGRCRFLEMDADMQIGQVYGHADRRVTRQVSIGTARRQIVEIGRIFPCELCRCIQVVKTNTTQLT